MYDSLVWRKAADVCRFPHRSRKPVPLPSTTLKLLLFVLLTFPLATTTFASPTRSLNGVIDPDVMENFRLTWSDWGGGQDPNLRLMPTLLLKSRETCMPEPCGHEMALLATANPVPARLSACFWRNRAPPMLSGVNLGIDSSSVFDLHTTPELPKSGSQPAFCLWLRTETTTTNEERENLT